MISIASSSNINTYITLLLTIWDIIGTFLCLSNTRLTDLVGGIICTLLLPVGFSKPIIFDRPLLWIFPWTVFEESFADGFYWIDLPHTYTLINYELYVCHVRQNNDDKCELDTTKRVCVNWVLYLICRREMP